MLSGLEQREESVPCVELYLEWKCLSSLMCQAVDNVQILIDMLTLQRIFEEHSSYRNHKLAVGRWGLEIIEKGNVHLVPIQLSRSLKMLW